MAVASDSLAAPASVSASSGVDRGVCRLVPQSVESCSGSNDVGREKKPWRARALFDRVITDKVVAWRLCCRLHLFDCCRSKKALLTF